MPEAPNPVNPLTLMRERINTYDTAFLDALQRGMRIRYLGDTSQTAADNRRELREILLKRVAVVEEIGRYKKANGIEALDPARKECHEQELIEQGTALGLPKTVVTKVYDRVHNLSLKIEKSG